jgi:hypothetical protein
VYVLSPHSPVDAKEGTGELDGMYSKYNWETSPSKKETLRGLINYSIFLTLSFVGFVEEEEKICG